MRGAAAGDLLIMDCTRLGVPKHESLAALLCPCKECCRKGCWLLPACRAAAEAGLLRGSINLEGYEDLFPTSEEVKLCSRSLSVSLLSSCSASAFSAPLQRSGPARTLLPGSDGLLLSRECEALEGRCAGGWTLCTEPNELERLRPRLGAWELGGGGEKRPKESLPLPPPGAMLGGMGASVGALVCLVRPVPGSESCRRSFAHDGP